jgi:5-methylcytosine-specific restriction endonuclease McrA
LIPVPRSPQPKVLQRNSAKWLTNLSEAQTHYQVLKSNPNAEKAKLQQAKRRFVNAQNKYCHPEIKSTLVNMFNGKCAYCESKITVVTYGAIEHFFPKSLYVELTFEWSNLLLSCDLCNDANHKGTNFPLDGNGGLLLIDPTDGMTSPNAHLEFVWDGIAGLASVYGRDQHGKTVETIFDLNGIGGRKELIDHRSKYVKRLLALLRLSQLGDNDAIALLQESCHPSAEYSAFALVYVRPHLPQL